jgi:hypothetical protein
MLNERVRLPSGDANKLNSTGRRARRAGKSARPSVAEVKSSGIKRRTSAVTPSACGTPRRVVGSWPSKPGI